MSLKKTAELESPHATYVSGDWEWRVLKVNAPKQRPEWYATWLVAAKSPNTFGSWEYGDTYAKDILNYATTRTQATDEFLAYIRGEDA